MPSGLVFDVVVANILRGPLVELMPRLSAYGGPGSALLLSGILTEQVWIDRCMTSVDRCASKCEVMHVQSVMNKCTVNR